MKEIRLLVMEIKNFKGIKELVLESNGKDLNIYGQNEAGKSTIADAWSWLLFNKDSQNQSTQKFDIKPLKDNGEPRHGLDTVVKATLQVGDSQLTLKKKYYEVWKKKRGSADKVFDGHTTDYYISGVKVKKKEFEEKIDELADERIFRLLTDPLYFNSELHWKARREILTELCGEITVNDVIGENDNLSELEEMLKERGAEKHKAVLRERMKGLNDDIEKIPTRIDECENNLPDVSGLDWKEVEQEITELKAEKKEKEKELAQAGSGGRIAEKQKRLTEIENELLQIKNSYTAKNEKKIAVKKEEITEIEDKIRNTKSTIKDMQSEKQQHEQEIKQLENRMDELRSKWNELNQEKKELIEENWSGDTVCPTCGQELPKEQVEESKAEYNRKKADRIEEIAEKQEEINQDGQQKKQQVESIKQDINRLNGEIEGMQEDVGLLEDKLVEKRNELAELKKEGQKYQEDFEYKKKLSEKKNVKQAIEQLKSGNEEQLQLIDNEIAEIEQKIEKKQEQLQDIKSYNKGQKRIEELEKKEEGLAKKYEELEREMALCEQYEKTHAELLEEKVNGLFDMAEFKLFKTYQNGNIDPTCQTLYNGVPYNTNLNDGHKVKVGIDIINTLAEHFGFRAPIFADNMESVTGKIKTDSQLIKLVVSEDDEELRVEEAEKQMREAV